MKRNLFIFAFVTVVFVECSVYHPHAIDIPLIEHQGDTRMDVSVSASTFIGIPDQFTVNATVTHGFNSWMAGQAHFGFGGNSFYLQAAPGAFMKLGEKGVLEGYFGVGYGGSLGDGNGSNIETSYIYEYKGHYVLPFAQVNIGARHLGPLELGFGLKAGCFIPDFNYTRVYSNGTPYAPYRYDTPGFLLEPQVMLRLGSEEVAFTLRVGYAWMPDFVSNADHFMYDYFTLGAGLELTF